MITLYVTSTEEFAGKTSLAIGLGKHLQREGYIVGYMRALTTRVQQVEDRQVAQDAEFVRQELALVESPEDIVPIALTPSLVERAIQDPQGTDFKAKLKAAYGRVSYGKDILILEGGGHFLEGRCSASPQPRSPSCSTPTCW